MRPHNRILLVYPRFSRNNLLNYEQMTPFYPGRRAVMPPLGLLILAAALRDHFEVRLVDENVRTLGEDDLHWADVVALSGMHPQRPRITAILEAANRLGKVTVLGGPSVSICPEYYPQADLLHVGEMGDATAELIEFLRTCPGKPGRQRIFRTTHKTPIEELPLPALETIRVNAYIIMPVQFSVGCPYTCEFCDIPAIYGRIARIKSGARIVRELQAIYDTGFIGTVLFVDDNLIANRKALRAMLPEVIDWQRRHRYPFPLTGEATINMSRDPEILRLLHEARFTHMFFGIETPDEETLQEISKRQNLQDPLIESLRRIQAHGIEIIMGMIFGFDTDTEQTGQRVIRFVKEANGPLIYFNLLTALPKTPLWERLTREGRLIEHNGDARQSERLMSCLTSNVRFKLPAQVVSQMLRDTAKEVYSPAEVYRRFLWNAEHVYGNQIQGVPPSETWAQRRFLIRFSLETLWRVVRDVGLRSDYRDEFWRYLWRLIQLRRQGRIHSVLEVLLRTVPNAHHLIQWARILLEDTEQAAVDDRPAQAPTPAPAPVRSPRLNTI
jgi:radical SAM superfamily enzyme YgiQ (UPF0313 family)